MVSLNECVIKAAYLIARGYPVGNMDEESLGELLYKMELEKEEKNEKTDKLIDYNDEIVEIECVGDLETVDISVSGDNLFYCNDVLTKNSFGLPATADFMCAIVNTEELEELNQVMIKQLKNRWHDINSPKRFVLGIDKARMKLYNLDASAQQGLMQDGKKQDDDIPVMDRTDFGKGLKSERKDWS